MASKVQLEGGAFQDAAGNPLADGYLLMRLSQDGVVNSDEQVASGIELKIALDSSGNVVTSPAQYVWPNDVITPSGTFYTVSAYTANGELVWGQNSQMVFSTPSPFNIGAWVPGAVSTSTLQITNYDIGVFLPGQALANQVVLLLPVERVVYFANNFSPSVAACGTNPTASVVFALNQNGAQIGTLTIATSGAATFSSTDTVTTFDTGDVLTIVGPSSPDATLANLGITLSGTIAVAVSA